MRQAQSPDCGRRGARAHRGGRGQARGRRRGAPRAPGCSGPARPSARGGRARRPRTSRPRRTPALAAPGASKRSARRGPPRGFRRPRSGRRLGALLGREGDDPAQPHDGVQHVAGRPRERLVRGLQREGGAWTLRPLPMNRIRSVSHPSASSPSGASARGLGALAREGVDGVANGASSAPRDGAAASTSTSRGPHPRARSARTAWRTPGARGLPRGPATPARPRS